MFLPSGCIGVANIHDKYFGNFRTFLWRSTVWEVLESFEEVAFFPKSEKGTIVSKFGGTLPYLRLLARPSHNQAASARLGSSLGLLSKLVSNQNSFP